MINKWKCVLPLALVFSTPVWASGFYIGGGLGPETTNYKQDSHVVVRLPPRLISNVKDTTHLSGTGIFGTLFAGYGYTWSNQFYLAGEINANVSTDEFSSENLEFVNGTAAHTHYRMQNSFGISLLPGYVYQTLLFYARLGYSNGNFKISTSDPSISSVNERLSGFRFGLGIEKSFTPNFSARMEYSQTNYRQTSTTTVDTPAVKTVAITPTTGLVEFSMVYHFA